MAKPAIKKAYRDAKGELKLQYVDAETGQPLQSLDGYQLIEQGENFNKEGMGFNSVAQTQSKKQIEQNQTTAQGQEPDYKGPTFGRGQNTTEGTNVAPRTQSNNFGYIQKGTFMKAVAMMPGMVGLGGKMVSMMANANNVAAAQAARKQMGLPEMTSKEVAKGIMSDQKGFVGDVSIGGKTYAVGLDAVTPTGRTTLTPTEASKRSAMLGFRPQLASPEESKKAELDAKANPDVKPGGFISRAIKSVLPSFGEKGTYNAPVAREVAQDFTPSNLRNLEGLQFGAKNPNALRSVQAAKQINPLGIGTPKNPNAIPGDPLGRTRLDQIDWDATPLHPEVKERFKEFTRKAEEQGIASKLAVDTNSMRRTPEEQKSIKDQGFSKTTNSYHMPGFAVDISPVGVDAKGNITDQKTLEASRALASSLGFSLLNPSWDPAHMEVRVPNETAKSLQQKALANPLGIAQLSPEQSLSVLGSAVPTPEDKPQRESMVAQAAEAPTKSAVTPTSAIQRSEDDRNRMAYTIAGELGQKTIAGIMSANPQAQETARQEIASIASTMDNRAKSTRYAALANPMQSVLDPSQYNSLTPANQKVTQNNYQQVGNFINQALTDYDMGTLQSPVPSATHYYNASIANPAWGSQMTDSAKIGEHTFGTIARDYTRDTSHDAGGGNVSASRSRTMGFGSDNFGSDTGSTSGFGNTKAGSVAGQRSAGVGSRSSNQAAESSFGGFHAGSLGGTASGLGSGLGKAGSDAGAFGGFSGSSQPSQPSQSRESTGRAHMSSASTGSSTSSSASKGFGGAAAGSSGTSSDNDNDKD